VDGVKELIFKYILLVVDVMCVCFDTFDEDEKNSCKAVVVTFLNGGRADDGVC